MHTFFADDTMPIENRYLSGIMIAIQWYAEGAGALLREKLSTDVLLNELLKTHSVNRFFKRFEMHFSTESLSMYLNRLCAERDILAAHVIRNAGVERTFGHQIFNGRRVPSRDKVIQLAFGFGMNFTECQELMKKARKSPLYAKVKRDAVFIYALKNGLDIERVQATLNDLSLPTLGKLESDRD